MLEITGNYIAQAACTYIHCKPVSDTYNSYTVDTCYTARYYQNTCCYLYISFLSRSQPAFHGFVSAIVADGGGDGPEDIMGALKVVFRSLSWRSEGSKVYQQNSLYYSSCAVVFIKKCQQISMVTITIVTDLLFFM